MNTVKIIIVLALAVLISACSMFHKKEEPTLYQSNVKALPPLALPADLTKEGQEDDYPLPKLTSQPPSTKVTILPPGSSLVNEKKK